YCTGDEGRPRLRRPVERRKSRCTSPGARPLEDPRPRVSNKAGYPCQLQFQLKASQRLQVLSDGRALALKFEQLSNILGRPFGLSLHDYDLARNGAAASATRRISSSKLRQRAATCSPPSKSPREHTPRDMPRFHPSRAAAWELARIFRPAARHQDIQHA